MTGYRTIVADPPWEVDRPVGGYGVDGERRKAEVARAGPLRPLDYQTLTVDEIKALPVWQMSVGDFAGQSRRRRRDAGLPTHDGSHLYLWTTTEYLAAAEDVARAWGFEPSAVLVWCKPPGGFVGGTFYANVEFVVYARRGAPSALAHVNTRWFNWPRGAHSVKPDAFIDMVERVSPGPYLELFARRARFGWDYAGDGSLGTVDVPGLRAPGMAA